VASVVEIDEAYPGAFYPGQLYPGEGRIIVAPDSGPDGYDMTPAEREAYIESKLVGPRSW
jgi:hypothetical protein